MLTAGAAGMSLVVGLLALVFGWIPWYLATAWSAVMVVAVVFNVWAARGSGQG